MKSHKRLARHGIASVATVGLIALMPMTALADGGHGHGHGSGRDKGTIASCNTGDNNQQHGNQNRVNSTQFGVSGISQVGSQVQDNGNNQSNCTQPQSGNFGLTGEVAGGNQGSFDRGRGHGSHHGSGGIDISALPTTNVSAQGHVNVHENQHEQGSLHVNQHVNIRNNVHANLSAEQQSGGSSTNCNTASGSGSVQTGAANQHADEHVNIHVNEHVNEHSNLHVNGHINEHSHAHAKGHANLHTNGHINEHSNVHINEHANLHTNVHANLAAGQQSKGSSTNCNTASGSGTVQVVAANQHANEHVNKHVNIHVNEHNNLHLSGHLNEHSNGHANEHSNVHVNEHVNLHTNGHVNEHTNGHANLQAEHQSKDSSTNCNTASGSGTVQVAAANQHANEHVNKPVNIHVNEHSNIHVNGHINQHTNVHVNAHLNSHTNVHVNEHTNVHTNAHTNTHVNIHVSRYTNVHYTGVEGIAAQLETALTSLGCSQSDYVYAYLQTVTLQESTITKIQEKCNEVTQLVSSATTNGSSGGETSNTQTQELSTGDTVKAWTLLIEIFNLCGFQTTVVNGHGGTLTPTQVATAPQTESVNIVLRDKHGSQLSTIAVPKPKAVPTLTKDVRDVQTAATAAHKLQKTKSFVPAPSGQLPETATQDPLMILVGLLMAVVGGLSLGSFALAKRFWGR